MRRRGTALFVLGAGTLFGLLTACAALIGVNDNFYDADAALASSSSSGGSSGTTSSSGASSGGDANPDAPLACNADITTDKANCGACGHDCTNGECAGGICTLTRDLPSPQAIAVRAGFVYLGFVGDVGVGSGLFKCPSNGCASANVGLVRLTPDDAGYLEPNSIAVNGTHVYANDYYGFNNGGVLRVTIDGNNFTRLPPSNPGFARSGGVLLDDASIVWSENDSDGGLYACATPDCVGNYKVVIRAPNPRYIVEAADGTLIYTDNDDYKLKKCASKTTCTNPTELVTFVGWVTHLAIDNGTVYFSTRSNTGGKILSCAVGGCANPTTIVDQPDHISTFVVQADKVFWASLPADPEAGTILPDVKGRIEGCTIGMCTGTAKRVISTTETAPESMALDDKSVYWANSGSYGYTDGIGQVRKAPR